MTVCPKAILGQARRPSHWTGRVPTFTGKSFSPWSPTPGDVDPTDIAYGLAHTFRYGGQSDPAITVAEHSVFVSRIIELLWPNRADLVRVGLLHDAAEAYLHDIQGPLRQMVKVHLPSGETLNWDESDMRLTAHICGEFQVEGVLLHAEEVRAADILAVCFEKRDCNNLTGDWGLPAIPLEIEKLHLDFLNVEDAMMAFLDRWSELGLR